MAELSVVYFSVFISIVLIGYMVYLKFTDEHFVEYLQIVFDSFKEAAENFKEAAENLIEGLPGLGVHQVGQVANVPAALPLNFQIDLNAPAMEVFAQVFEQPLPVPDVIAEAQV